MNREPTSTPELRREVEAKTVRTNGSNRWIGLKDLPANLPKEYFAEGHRACQGCGEVLAIRQFLKVAGPETIVCCATGCAFVVSTPSGETAWRIPWIHTAFENAAAVASGVEAGINVLRRKGRYRHEKVNVVALAGDGGTADIGLQALSGAFERRHKFIFVCIDNEAYMNTGVHRSSATPFGASTTTSPAGEVSTGQRTEKKNMPLIAEAHGIPYVATCCPSYPLDLMEKAKKALDAQGPSYLHILAPCPTGWKYESQLTVTMGKLAVETGVFPLYEVEDGTFRLTVKTGELRPVSGYLGLQGRFNHPNDLQVAVIQETVQKNYEGLAGRESCMNETDTSRPRSLNEVEDVSTR